MFFQNQIDRFLLKGRGGHAYPLGYTPAKDRSHEKTYALAALPEAEWPVGVPITIGINWYGSFDTPELYNGRYWIARNGKVGTLRGGHCICVKSTHQTDPLSSWSFYDQGKEGACVGFGTSRMMSLLNRKKYDAHWLWDIAKAGDEFPDTNPGDDNGTSVHAGIDVLLKKGHVPWQTSYAGRTWQQRDTEAPSLTEGVSAIRWATSVDEMRKVLDTPLHDQLQAFPLLNSWGRYYAHLVWLPYTVMERLIKEDGEIALVTDR